MTARPNKAGYVVLAGAGIGLLAMLTLGRKGEAMPTKKKGKVKVKVGPATVEPIDNGQAKAVALAVKFSNTFDVPASLVIALIQVESGNRSDAINLKNARGGAWGLMQMTLETAKDLTKRFPAVAAKYWPKFDGTGPSLLDPSTNVAIGAFQTSLLWKRYKGKPSNWLTTGLAYHQGSGNVDKFLSAGGGKINPKTLPPNGKTYLAWLVKQVSSNSVVAKALKAETSRFTYA